MAKDYAVSMLVGALIAAVGVGMSFGTGPALMSFGACLMGGTALAAVLAR